MNLITKKITDQLNEKISEIENRLDNANQKIEKLKKDTRKKINYL